MERRASSPVAVVGQQTRKNSFEISAKSDVSHADSEAHPQEIP